MGARSNRRFPDEDVQAGFYERLIGVVQEFVLREGTGYGGEDIPLDVKVEQVIVQLEAEEIGIFYDSELETTTIQLMETWENPEKKI